MPQGGLLGGVGRFLGFGGGGQQQQQPAQLGPSMRDQVEAEQLRRLQQPAPPPGFEGKTPAGSRPRILVDVATRLQAGQSISTQDAQRYNIARSQAGQPTTSFRNGVLVTTPGLSPEALSRLPTTEQVFAAVGQDGGQQFQSPQFSLPSQDGSPSPVTGGLSTLDFLPGGAGAGPAPTAPPTPLGAQPQPAPPTPIPVTQPQVTAPQPAITPQPPVEPIQITGSGQSIADAPPEIIPNLPQPRFLNIPTGDGTTVRQIDPGFGKQRELEVAAVTKRGTELEDTRAALGSVRQLFSLSKTTDTGKFEQFTLPIRSILADLDTSFDFGLVDTDKVARQQMFDALQTRMVPINRAGTPGQVSNIEFQAYKEASSSLGNLPYANVLLAGGLLQQRARSEALQTFVSKAVTANPGLTQTEAAKMFERKAEDQLRNHPSGGFIVTEKGGTTMPMLNAQMENGQMQSYTGGRAAYDSMPDDTLFRGADGTMYMKGSKHTDPFRADYTGKR